MDHNLYSHSDYRLSGAQFWFNAVFFVCLFVCLFVFAIFKSFWTKGSTFSFALVFTTAVHTHLYTHQQRLLDQTSQTSEPSFWLALYSPTPTVFGLPISPIFTKNPKKSVQKESFIVDTSSISSSPIFDVWILGLSLARILLGQFSKNLPTHDVST